MPSHYRSEDIERTGAGTETRYSAARRSAIESLKDRYYSIRHPSGLAKCGWISGTVLTAVLAGFGVGIWQVVEAGKRGSTARSERVRADRETYRQLGFAQGREAGYKECRLLPTPTVTETFTVTASPTSAGTTASASGLADLVARCLSGEGCGEGQEVESALSAMVGSGLKEDEAMRALSELFTAIEMASTAGTAFSATPSSTTFTASPTPYSDSVRAIIDAGAESKS